MSNINAIIPIASKYAKMINAAAQSCVFKVFMVKLTAPVKRFANKNITSPLRLTAKNIGKGIFVGASNLTITKYIDNRIETLTAKHQTMKLVFVERRDTLIERS